MATKQRTKKTTKMDEANAAALETSPADVNEALETSPADVEPTAPAVVEDAPKGSKNGRGKKKTLAEMDAFDLFVQERHKTAKKDWQSLSDDRKQHYEEMLDKRKKRPKSEYQLFLAARSVELAESHPHISFSERSKLCASEWKLKKARDAPAAPEVAGATSHEDNA